MTRVIVLVVAALLISGFALANRDENTNCQSVHVSRKWDEWKVPEPEWVTAVVNDWEGLADAICQAQGSKLTDNSYQCDAADSRPGTPIQITLTNDLSLRGRRLPDIWGSVKIVGACGGVGKRCAIHAVTPDCSNCDTIWDVPEDRVPFFDHCTACSEAPLSVFRYDNTPFNVRNSGRLWLQHLDLAGAHSTEAGGILRTLKGTSEVWVSDLLENEMTYVYAEDVSFRNGFSTQQGGAAMADQGTLMVLRNCEFVKNFAGPDLRDRIHPSAHDVSVANYAKVLVEAATPAIPEVRLQSLVDVDRELGQCIIARGIPGEMVTPAPTMAPILPPPPPPAVDISKMPNRAGGLEVADHTWRVVIIASSAIGGTILLTCTFGIMCCMRQATDEERSLPAMKRVRSVVSRQASVGLARLLSTKPRFVRDGDILAELSQETTEADKARREAERRADRAERALREKAKATGGGFKSMSFGKQMFESIRSFSRMVSQKRSGSRFSLWGREESSEDIVSLPMTSKQERKHSSEVQSIMKAQNGFSMDTALPNQPSDIPSISITKQSQQQNVKFREP